MTGPRRVDTAWPQTVQMQRRTQRTRHNPYQRRQREPIRWDLCLMVAGAVFLVALVFVYKLTGPA